jgi:hypothetical protein
MRPAPSPAIVKPLSVLIAFEESGVVRRAFAELGHDAWSCDLKPSRDGSNRHIRGDVRDHLHDGWDLLIVAHPPCTRLTNSGVRWLKEPCGQLNLEHYTQAQADAYAMMNREERLAFLWSSLEEGAALFSAAWNAPIDRIAVENPVMHKHAKARIVNYADPAQTVQPWYFGDEAFKATSFYLRGLPALKDTNRLTPPKAGTEEHKKWSAVHNAPPGPKRSEIRSQTFPGIAKAMASQWGGYALEQHMPLFAA